MCSAGAPWERGMQAIKKSPSCMDKKSVVRRDTPMGGKNARMFPESLRITLQPIARLYRVVLS